MSWEPGELKGQKSLEISRMKIPSAQNVGRVPISKERNILICFGIILDLFFYRSKQNKYNFVKFPMVAKQATLAAIRAW